MPLLRTARTGGISTRRHAPCPIRQRIRALVAYFHTVQLLLSARLVQLLEEWLDAPISEGSIYNIVQESAARLEALREPIKRSCWLPRFCTPMKRASPSKENGIGSMWPAHRKPRGCFAIPNGGGKRWRPSVFSPVSGNHHARCMGAIFSVHRGGTRPVQRPLASRAAGLAQSASSGLGETLKRPVARDEPARQRSWRSAHRRASPGARSGMGPPCPTSRFVGAFAAPQRIRNGGQGNQKAPSPSAGTENGDPSIFAGTACAV